MRALTDFLIDTFFYKTTKHFKMLQVPENRLQQVHQKYGKSQSYNQLCSVFCQG